MRPGLGLRWEALESILTIGLGSESYCAVVRSCEVVLMKASRSIRWVAVTSFLVAGSVACSNGDDPSALPSTGVPSQPGGDDGDGIPSSGEVTSSGEPLDSDRGSGDGIDLGEDGAPTNPDGTTPPDDGSDPEGGHAGGDSEGVGGTSDPEGSGGSGSQPSGGTGEESEGGSNGFEDSVSVDDLPPVENTGGSMDPPTGTGGSMDPPTGTGGSIDPPIGTGGSIDPPIGTGGSADPPIPPSEDPPPEEPPPTQDPPPPVQTECADTDLDSVSVIVFNEAAPSGADSEGRMFIGGNADLSGYSVGTSLEYDCNRYDLVLGGDVVNISGGSVNNGAIAYSTINPEANSPNFSNVGAPCGTHLMDPLPIDLEALEVQMQRYSKAMSEAPSTGTVDGSGTLTLTGATSGDYIVFNLTADQLATASSIEFEGIPDDMPVIVNVGGEVIQWNGVGFSYNGAQTQCKSNTGLTICDQIVWNFYEATELHFSGIGVQGSVLAPYATLDGSGGMVDGQVIVQNLYGQLEYHPFFFNQCLIWI